MKKLVLVSLLGTCGFLFSPQAGSQVVSGLGSLSNRIPVGDPDVDAVDDEEGPKAITTADLNGDGRPDLAVGNLDGTVTLLFGADGGGFEPARHLATGAEELRAVEAGDLDADGDVDLVIASPSDGKLNLLLNEGGGSFGSPVPLGGWRGVRAVALGDFDGDAITDLAAAGPGIGLRHFRGTGGGQFEIVGDLPRLGPEVYVLPRPVFSMHVIRSLDGTRDDLLVTNAESSSLYILSTRPADRSGEPPLSPPPPAWGALESGVLLTEVQVHNDATLLDEDGEAQPWVELFNSAPVPVSLAGWKLQVDTGEWVLPAISIQPGRFAVVFLSGKDRAVGEIHAGISMDGNSGSVAIVSPVGKSHAIDLEQHAVPDISYGLEPGGVDPRWFDLPSPGTSNHAGFKKLGSVRTNNTTTGLTIDPAGAGSVVATVRTGESTLNNDKLSNVWFSVVDGIEEKHYPLTRAGSGVYSTKLGAHQFSEGMRYRVIGRFQRHDDEDETFTRELYVGLDDDESDDYVEPRPGSLQPVASVPSPKVKSFDIGTLISPVGEGTVPDLVYSDDECGLLRVHRGVATVQRFEMLPKQDLQIRGAPRDVKLADIDGDGWLDATVVLRGLDLTLTCRNDQGVLKVTGELPTGSSPRALVMADFSGDDLPDAAVINRYSSDVSIITTSAAFSGLVSSDQIYPVDGEVARMRVTDWNGDGRDDVVQLHRGSGEISVRYANPDGSLADPEFIVLAGDLPSGLATADLNGDGVLDTVTADLGFAGGGGTISTLLSQPDGGLVAGPTIRGIGSMFAISVADFDNDGHTDIVAGLFDCRISFFRGDGTGAFTYTRTQEFVSESRLMVVDDFDQDGDIDVAGAGYQGTVVVIENPGNLLTQVGDRTLYPAPSRNKFGSERIAIFDANGDPDPDLLIGSGAGVMIYLGSSGATFEFDEIQSNSIPEFPVNDVVTLDLDGNGTLEMVVLCQQAACVNIFTQSAPGEPFTLLSQASIPPGRYLASGDLDGDGKPDIVCTGDVLWTVLSSRPPEIAAPRVTDSQRESTTGVLINEVLTRNTGTPVSTDAGRKTDFIEIYNATDDEVSLAGWKIDVVGMQDGEPFDKTHTIPGRMLPPKGHAVILFSDNVENNPEYTGFNLPAERSDITLRRADDSVADSTQTPPALDNVSWARFRDGHPKFHSDPIPSPAMSNIDNGTPDPDVKLAAPSAEKLVAGQPIRFTARGNDDVGIVSLSLLWRRLDAPGETKRLVLYDDGMHDDGLTTDGFFAGEMDETLPAGAEVQFYLEAVDLSGNVTILPDGGELVEDGSRPTAWSFSLEEAPSLEIIEVAVDGNGAYRDESDKKADYIIVRNTGDGPVDMGGILLARSPLSSSSSTYAFPDALTLSPGAEAVVFADGDVEDGPMHAPFQLSRGEELSLLAETASGARRWVYSMVIPDDLGLNTRLLRLPGTERWTTSNSSRRDSPAGYGNPSVAYDREGVALPSTSIQTVDGGSYLLQGIPLGAADFQDIQAFVGDGTEMSFVETDGQYTQLRITSPNTLPAMPQVGVTADNSYCYFYIHAPRALGVRVFLAQPGVLGGDPELIPIESGREGSMYEGIFRAYIRRPVGDLPYEYRVRAYNSSGVVWTDVVTIAAEPNKTGFDGLGMETLDATSATVTGMLDLRAGNYQNVRVAFGTSDAFFIEGDWSHVQACDLEPGTSTWRSHLSGLQPGVRYFARFFADAGDGTVIASLDRLDFVTGDDSLDLVRWGLRFSEIMYHPLGESDEEEELGFTENDFEYIELHNATDRPIDLTGWYFTEGIELNFPLAGGPVLAPGEYGVIAANPAAFAHRHGEDIPIMAYTSHPFRESKLSNGGETLRMSSPDDRVQISTYYNDTRFGDDGAGHSLVIGPSGRWMASRARGGSPGDVLPLIYTSFADWQQVNFDALQLGNPAIVDPGSDPDDDGLNNDVEFLYGSGPLDGATRESLTMVGEVLRYGQRFLEFEFEQAPEVEPAVIAVERLASQGQFESVRSWDYYTHRLRWSADRKKLVRTIHVHQRGTSEGIYRLRFEFE